MASAWMPLASAMRATVMAFLWLRSQPVRIFRVTGMLTAPTTASRICCTSGSFCSRADPAITLHTFLAGQPMLMSMICAPWSALYFAASAIIFGSAPAICTDLGSTSPVWSARRRVFSEPHSSELLATISETAMPAPSCLHS